MSNTIVMFMHKDDPISRLEINSEGVIVNAGPIINPELLPIYLQNSAARLNHWFQDRAVPNTRDGLRSLLDECGAPTAESFLVNNLGLSLNDSYWLKPDGSGLTWASVNLFDNDFDPAEPYAMMGKDTLHDVLKLTPDASLKGELKKKWVIDDEGTRVLVKGNYGDGCQQSLNEKLATMINSRQKWTNYVSYNVFEYSFDGSVSSFCCFSKNFILSDKTEFIPAWEILSLMPKQQGVSGFHHFVNCCERLGLDRDAVIEFLSYQILLDYSMTNVDRHANNFGIIRDADSLKPLGMAPIYDCGNSMLFDQLFVKYNPHILDKIQVNSFRKNERDLLSYVSDFALFDVDKVPSDDEIRTLYSAGNTMSEETIEELLKCFHYKLSCIARRQYPNGISGPQ